MPKNADVFELDAESIGCLEDVKKGKPRRFAMICKGVNVISLFVYKKGTVEKYKKLAKEVGQGQFYHGVVAGSGLDIRFQLARSDGFEKAPTKSQTLKQFLNEASGVAFKPDFEILETPPDIHDEDQADSRSRVESTLSSAPEDESAARTKLSTQLNTVLPRIKEAVSAHPQRKEELLRPLAEIKKYLDGTLGSAEHAREQLISLVRLLQDLSGIAAQKEPSSIPARSVTRIWAETKESLDRQINMLQQACLSTGEERFKRIGEFGIGGIRDRLSVGLQASLFDLESTTGDEREAAKLKALNIVGQYKDLVKSDIALKLCDSNPFGLKINLRASLASGILALEKALLALN